jgi:arylsulfatase A-like enzyme
MPADRPNIVIIYTDDLGYGDLPCMGDTHVRTPHLDALAGSGIRFTDWYSNCAVCSGGRGVVSARDPRHVGGGAESDDLGAAGGV